MYEKISWTKGPNARVNSNRICAHTEKVVSVLRFPLPLFFLSSLSLSFSRRRRRSRCRCLYTLIHCVLFILNFSLSIPFCSIPFSYTISFSFISPFHTLPFSVWCVVCTYRRIYLSSMHSIFCFSIHSLPYTSDNASRCGCVKCIIHKCCSFDCFYRADCFRSRSILFDSMQLTGIKNRIRQMHLALVKHGFIDVASANALVFRCRSVDSMQALLFRLVWRVRACVREWMSQWLLISSSKSLSFVTENSVHSRSSR